MSRKNVSSKVLAVITASVMLTVMAKPVTAAEESNQPVTAYADNGKTESVSTGTVSIEGAVANQPAVAAIAESGSEATVTVDGDVSVNVTEAPNDDDYSSAMGILENASSDASATVNVSGDVNVSFSGENGGSYGVNIMSLGTGADLSVTVDGDLSVSNEADFAGGVIVSIQDKDSTGTVEIGGDVSVSGNNGNSGVMANALNGGEANVIVDGNVEATGKEGSVAVSTAVSSDGKASVQVGGDVHGSDCGLSIGDYGAGTIDVVIEGTLSGDIAPISVSSGNPETNVSVTVWKIEPNKDQKIISYYEVPEEDMDEEWAAEAKEYAEKSKAAAEALEKNILYIIKVEQPKAGGTLALAGTTDSHGFATAKEGETVTLKATLQNGYRIKGAYNGTTALTLIDKDGNYYIVVPKGGGVSLSMILEQIQSGYIPSAPAAETVKEKKLIDEYAFTAADSEAKISFYDDSTFVITLPGGAKAEGTFAFVDGKLTFNGVELDVTIAEDGSYHCIYTPANGDPVEFVLSAEFVESLRKACEKQV